MGQILEVENMKLVVDGDKVWQLDCMKPEKKTVMTKDKLIEKRIVIASRFSPCFLLLWLVNSGQAFTVKDLKVPESLH